MSKGLLKTYQVNDPLFKESMVDMDKDYFPPHAHTKFSAKDALSDPNEYCARAKELGYTTVTATEHGVLYSVVEMAKAAKKNGLKFIPGCEVYETDDRTHHSRSGQEVYHFLLLAANDQGYKDLMAIVSDAGTVGKFDDNERTDFDYIEQNNLGKNLIATSACLGSRISQLLMAGDYQGAKNVALRLKDMFYQFYLEVQDNEIKEQTMVNMQLIKMSEETGIPLVLTSDIHYVNSDDGDHHDTLICIGFKNKKHDPNRYRYQGNYPYFLRSPREMYDWAKRNSIPLEAVYNAKMIADHVEVEIPMGLDLLPKFPTPKGFDPANYMERLCFDSLERYSIEMMEAGTPINMQEYIDRLNMEVKVIRDKDYPGYFLTLWDFVEFLKREGIFQGPGRGSAAGSLIAYLLDITKLDPIIYDLQFERFLNPERNSMPDIDIDIPDIHRPKCIDYIQQKYGRENVAQIMTFGEIGVKSGVRDLVRVLELDPAIVNEISELVPDKMPDQSDVTLDALMDLATNADAAAKFDGKGGIVDIAKRFKGYMDEFPEIYEALERIEGSVRNKGIHAGGVIICKDKISNYAPIERGSATAVLNVCAFPMGTCEDIGLLKMDFLGLRTLSVVAVALENIWRTTGKKIDLYKIGRNDKKVFELLREGHTHAIFQVSGGGITHYMKQVKPSKFNDVIDVLALFRPGPLEAEVAAGVTMTDRYVENGEIHPDDYLEEVDERIRPIMEKTRGVLIYQEQIMSMVRDMAGYTLGGADSFRRVIGKKKIKEVAALRWQFLYGKDAPKYIKAAMDKESNEDKLKALKDQLYIVEGAPVTAEGAIARGWSMEDAEEWFQALGKFAGYGFNRSHSAAYADLTYQTAWLKVHYPVEFMAAQLTSEAGDKDKEIANLNEAKRMGIKILPPDINLSVVGYVMDEWEDDEGEVHPAIRMGMKTIAGVGDGVIEEIINERKTNGAYASFSDFINRVSGKTVNKNKVDSLIRAGCFDFAEPNRYKLLNHYYFNIRGDKEYNGTPEMYFLNKKSKDKNIKPKTNEYPVHNPLDYTDEVKLNLEKEFVHIFVSGHPLEDLPYKPWSSVHDGEDVELGGRIEGLRKIKTKKGDPMAFLKLETQAETIDVTIFPRQYEKFEDRLFKGNNVIIKGTKQVQKGKEGLLADAVKVPRKKKHRVERDLEEEPLEFEKKERGKKRQQQIDEDLPPLQPKADPLEALFN